MTVAFEPGTPADAGEVAALIRSLSAPFLQSPDGAGAERFFTAIGEPAVAGYLSSPRHRYLVARSDGSLVGLIAVRDNAHLFHLFVAPAHQGRGLARSLWSAARSSAIAAGHDGPFTVNASLNALGVYRRFGFVAQGDVVQTDGVAFQPMVRAPG